MTLFLLIARKLCEESAQGLLAGTRCHATTSQLGEKARMGGASILQGLKLDSHFVGFAAWLKPCPCYKTVGSLLESSPQSGHSSSAVIPWAGLRRPVCGLFFEASRIREIDCNRREKYLEVEKVIKLLKI